LVDTVRRIIETSTLARAWKITRAAKIEELEANGKKYAARKLREQPTPWEADTIGDRLSVQEWTGPAAFTDAVLSYANIPRVSQWQPQPTPHYSSTGIYL
jgi:hypothetical protein